jgi:hypothetical protein
MGSTPFPWVKLVKKSRVKPDVYHQWNPDYFPPFFCCAPTPLDPPCLPPPPPPQHTHTHNTLSLSHTHTHTHRQTLTDRHSHTQTDTHTHTQTDTQKHRQTHTHTHTRTHTHTHTHHTHTQNSSTNTTTCFQDWVWIESFVSPQVRACLFYFCAPMFVSVECVSSFHEKTGIPPAKKPP